jgi:RHS repeat-associated protein
MRLDPETGLYYDRARYYSSVDGRFLQTDPVGYKADVDLYTYVGNDPTDRTDPTGLCDDVTGCNVQVQQQLSTPDAQRSATVTFAVGAPIIAATFVAVTTSSPAVATVAISAGAGGSLSAVNSARQGNSGPRVLADTGKGMFKSGVTATAGQLGGVAGKGGTISGEMMGAYASAKLSGESDAQATLTAVAAGAVGLLTMPAGDQASRGASGIAASFMKSLIKGEAKNEIKSGADQHQSGSTCTRQANGPCH